MSPALLWLFGALAALSCRAHWASLELVEEHESFEQGGKSCRRHFNFADFGAKFVVTKEPPPFVTIVHPVQSCIKCKNSLPLKEFLTGVVTAETSGQDCICKGAGKEFVRFRSHKENRKCEVATCLPQLAVFVHSVLTHYNYQQFEANHGAAHSGDFNRTHGSDFPILTPDKWKEPTTEDCLEGSQTEFVFQKFDYVYKTAIEHVQEQSHIVVFEPYIRPPPRGVLLLPDGTTCKDLPDNCRHAAASDGESGAILQLLLAGDLAGSAISGSPEIVQFPSKPPCDEIVQKAGFETAISFSVKKQGTSYEVPFGYSVLSTTDSELKIVRRGDATGDETAASDTDLRPICICEPL